MSSNNLPEFELLAPKSLDEAKGFLADYGKDLAVMAGGTDLLVQMKGGFKVGHVLSLMDIPDLNYVLYDDKGGLRIGAMATMADVVASKDVRENYNALWQSAAQSGTVQTRNSATVVGNLLRASPSGDCCCAILAHGGTLVLEGPSGRREVDMDDFWIDYMVTARQADELAVEVKLPAVGDETKSAFLSLTRTKQDLSKISAAASLKMDGKICSEPRLAMGAVAPVPLKLNKTEGILRGVELTDDVLEKAAQSGSQEIKPIDDIRSTAEYRRDVTGVLLKRVIKAAMG